MRYLKNFTILKILLAITFLSMLSTNSFTYWYANGSGTTYNSSSEGLSSPSSLVDDIDQYIVEGAGYFLDSYSYTLQFMRKVELSANRELNYTELSQLLDTALGNMKQARDTYKRLQETAEVTPYNPVVIEELKNFDYDRYCENNGLNKEIFTGVKSYLIDGRVTEIYGKLLADMDAMLYLLKLIKKNIDSNLFPPVKSVRKLNQTYSTALLFGQYVADVFTDLAIY
jgi:hypothetical protein